MLDRPSHLAFLPRPFALDDAASPPTGPEPVCDEPSATADGPSIDPEVPNSFRSEPDAASGRLRDAARFQELTRGAPTDPLTAAARHVASEGMPRDRTSNASHVITLPTEDEAQTVFGRAADALLDVSNWDGSGMRLHSDFELHSPSGRPAPERAASVGDFIRIDLPGNPIAAWVRVESLVIEPDRITMRVRPSYDPTERPLRPGVTAHFFAPSATNTFTLERHGRSVRLSVDGRHETPNTGATSGSYLTPIMNRVTTVGAFGYRGSGLQHMQWDFLTRELLGRAR